MTNQDTETPGGPAATVRRDVGAASRVRACATPNPDDLPLCLLSDCHTTVDDRTPPGVYAERPRGHMAVCDGRRRIVLMDNGGSMDFGGVEIQSVADLRKMAGHLLWLADRNERRGHDDRIEVHDHCAGRATADGHPRHDRPDAYLGDRTRCRGGDPMIRRLLGELCDLARASGRTAYVIDTHKATGYLVRAPLIVALPVLRLLQRTDPGTAWDYVTELADVTHAVSAPPDLAVLGYLLGRRAAYDDSEWLLIGSEPMTLGVALERLRTLHAVNIGRTEPERWTYGLFEIRQMEGTQ